MSLKVQEFYKETEKQFNISLQNITQNLQKVFKTILQPNTIINLQQ